MAAPNCEGVGLSAESNQGAYRQLVGKGISVGTDDEDADKAYSFAVPLGT